MRKFINIRNFVLVIIIYKQHISQKIIVKYCPFFHRLLAARIHIEGDETTTSSAFSIGGKLTVARMELLECLTENDSTEYVPLLTFSTDQQNFATNPSLKLNFKHIERTGKNGSRRVSKPKTEFS